MPVRGYPFIFDGQPSEFYQASIAFIDTDWTRRASGGSKTFTTYTPPRSATQHLLNVTQEQPLSFSVEIIFDEPTDIFGLTRVKTWLGAPFKYKQLRICAEGLERYYYNCYFVLEEDMIYNGGYCGVSATITCDAPWAWQNKQELVLGAGINTFYNVSEDQEPLKPILSFTTKSTNSYLFIENLIYTNSTTISYDRVTAFISGRSALKYVRQDGEIYDWTGDNLTDETEIENMQLQFKNVVNSDTTITLDNANGIITNSPDVKGKAKLENFNKIFLKIPRGKNTLLVTYQNISDIKLTYTNAVRIGGSFY